MKLIRCGGIVYDLDCPRDRPILKTTCGMVAGLVSEEVRKKYDR